MTAALLAALLATVGGATIQSAGEGAMSELRPLFDLTLQYRPGMAPVASAEGHSGRLLGSGDGRAAGPRVRGDVSWSIFEVTGQERCEVELAGIIQTDDGGRIEFQARGFGLVADPRQPNRWLMNAAVRFTSAVDGPYGWTNSLLAVWSGSFDMDTGRHVYGVYAPLASGD